ncbi:S41 family peptidase [Rheinheimera salexigens]|uniref:Tricorn protease homolog n=1 Tax=Rheinheimera salexigens TaxID=1628148 RepID=A0A1E7Q6B6_9GAMM|nr:S41 family peptidase [Rheinheimera salexigens]OEY69613.1 peptidase S41 [Rheinheimera salexigens]
MKLRYSVLSSALVACLMGSAYAADGYYRSPTLHNQQIIFTAEGDLWQASTHAADARRVTSHLAEESQAIISADGKQVAFVANYEGADEIYIMPLAGGSAKRLSFENSRVRIQQWLSDGRILYSTDSAVGPSNYWVLKTVDPTTLQRESIPLADASGGSIDDSGKQLFFTRFGISLSADNTKVYRGGALGELWRWQLDSDKEAVLLSKQHQGNISQPMYYQQRVYFVSDADGNSNIWSVDSQGNDFKQHSFHKEWRIGRASLSNGQIVYQLGADLHLLNLNDNSSQPVNIALASDRVQQRERWLDKPLNYLTSAHYQSQQADSQLAVITARGQIVISATGKRRLVQVDTPEGSRSREAVLSKDGNWVYAINDSSGENEIWRFAADGSKNHKQLTKDGTSHRWQLALSPDGRYIAHDDKAGDLWLLDVNSGKNSKVYQEGIGLRGYSDLVWSADSQLLAFTLNAANGERARLGLYNLADKQAQLITSAKYDSYSPTISPDGLWLYFVSNRKFTATPGSPWGDRNMGPMFDQRSEIFAVSLKQQACFGFRPEQELDSCNDKAALDSRNGKKGNLVDWQGVQQRLWQVPVAASNYYKLALNDKRLYMLDRATGANSKRQLKQVELSRTEAKVTTFASDVADYQLAADGKTLFVRQPTKDGKAEMLVVAATDKLPKELKHNRLNINNWQLALSPTEEWQQMFADAWRMHRDFLFDKGMRGLDWQASKEKYQPLLARVTDRYELDDVFAQMMGELNALHSQVRGGEYRQTDTQPKVASLGARFVAQKSGLKVEQIYRSDPEVLAMLSPLAKPGVDISEGDIITAVNGTPVNTEADLIQQLRNQAGKQVLLNVQRGKKQWQTVVVPAGQDSRLRYQDWVWHNQQKVTEQSNNEFGYLHLYAMGSGDVSNFAREFYANYDKKGLIIDVRRNRGGNIDSWIIEKLLRKAWAFWQPTQGAAYTNMQQTFRGHLVVLTDQLTYSDGETFAAGVKSLGLAPLVGKRTAGAGVWLSGRNRLSDNGMARVAETAQYAMDGSWIIEGYGVSPDVEVDNLPYATFNGEDAQLQHALDYLNKQLFQQPITPLKATLPTSGIAVDVKAL